MPYRQGIKVFLNISAHLLDGFAFAIEALAGRAIGSADRAGFHRAGRRLLLDGIYIGAPRKREMRDMMIVSLIAVMAVRIILIQAFGNHGLRVSIMVFFIFRALTLAIFYPALERDAFADETSRMARYT